MSYTESSKENLHRRGVVKVNLGSGPSGVVGWENYDWGILPLISKYSFLQKIVSVFKILPPEYHSKWPPIKLVDISRRLPLVDNSVDYIYCSHVLEHFHPWDAKKILEDCRRVMKPDATMRIVTPDIEKMVRIYLDSSDGYRAGRTLCNMWWGLEMDREPARFMERVAKFFTREHLWNYDKEEITFLLKSVGFDKVSWLSAGIGDVPDIKTLDTPDKIRTSLYVEVKNYD